VGELNSVTADSVFAEDTDVNDDPAAIDDTGVDEREQLGRFCPIRVTSSGSAQMVSDYTPGIGYPDINYAPPPSATAAVPKEKVVVNDFGYDPSYQSSTGRGTEWSGFWRYRWATDLFDYLSWWSPADDYLPAYPMQREWVEGESYNNGDLVSIYNPTIDATTGQPFGHQIYQTNAPVTGTAAAIPPAPFTLAFTGAPPVQNSLAKAAIRDPGDPAASHTEDDVPIEGLININTASWRVLATLPLVVNPTTGLPDDTTIPGYPAPLNTYRALNQELAKAIVYWRDVDANTDPPPGTGTPGANYSHLRQPHGPFKSIYELNEVVDLRKQPGGSAPIIVPPMPGGLGYPAGTLPGFRNGYWTMPLPATSTTEANDQLGDLGPADNPSTTASDNVRGDYKETNLQLTRISNLITTRSDSFTCYLIVQGWENAESTDPRKPPKPVVARRIAFTIDRSRVTPAPASVGSIAKQFFPNN
jgi:hypothetical protein